MVVAITSFSSPMESSDLLETLCYGEIEKTWLQSPSYINGVFLYIKRPLIDDL